MAEHSKIINRFGLVDEKVRAIIDKNRTAAQVAQQQALNQDPIDRAAAMGGLGLGIALQRFAAKKGWLKNEADETATAVEHAMGRAQVEVKALPSEIRAKGPIASAIQERQILIEELKASDLHEQADIVRDQIIGLMDQQNKFAKQSGEVALQTQELTRSQLETEAREADQFAKDETQRLVNVLSSLDLNDPVQAAKSVSLVARINKLTTITGTTEFDIPYDEVTVRRMDAALIANTGALDGFLEAADEFDPRFLELGSKIKNFFVSAIEIAGLDISDELKGELRSFTQFRQITSTNLNAYIKAITGAQMSNPEAIRLARDVPGIGDSPSQYKAKLDKVIRRLSAIRERSLAALSAREDPLAFRKIASSPLTDWMDVGERADEHKKRTAMLDDIFGVPSQEEVEQQQQQQVPQ